MSPEPYTRRIKKQLASLRNEPDLAFDELFAIAELQRPIRVPQSSGTSSFNNYGRLSTDYGSYGSMDEFLNTSFSDTGAMSIMPNSAPAAAEMATMGSGSVLNESGWSYQSQSPPVPELYNSFGNQNVLTEYALSSSSDSPALRAQSTKNSPAFNAYYGSMDEVTAFTEMDLLNLPDPVLKEEIPSLALSPPLLETNPLNFSLDTFLHGPDKYGFNGNSYRKEQDLSRFFTDYSPSGEPAASAASFPQNNSWSSMSPELHPQDFAGSASTASPELTPHDPKGLGWVRVEPMAKVQPVAASGRKAPGRRGPLSAAARKKAALMRGKACKSCKERKASCDNGLACRSCIRYHGPKLLLRPCRDGKMLESLTQSLLHGDSDGSGIFPSARGLDSFLTPGFYKINEEEFPMRLSLGFGPPLPVRVNVVYQADGRTESLEHEHVVYAWPPVRNQATKKAMCRHRVFPAVLAPKYADTNNLPGLLDKHFEKLVDNHFELFPNYESELDVLKPIYKYYLSLVSLGAQVEKERRLLQQCLKLLTLVHIAGDAHLHPSDTVAIQISEQFFGPLSSPLPGGRPSFGTCPSNLGDLPTPCFIRGQLGAVMPQLAEELMNDILQKLQELSLDRDCAMWATAFSGFAILTMVGESADHHACKDGFHAKLDATPLLSGASNLGRVIAQGRNGKTTWPGAQSEQSSSDGALEHLLKFYKNCFDSCHQRLNGEMAGRSRSNSSLSASVSIEAQNTLVRELREVLSISRSYINEKTVTEGRLIEDLSWMFDRKLAKLFSL